MDNRTIQEILQLRKQGMGMKLIAKQLSIDFYTVRYHCKKNNLGGVLSGPDKEREALQIFLSNLSNNHPKLQYVSGYNGSDSLVTIKCSDCDFVFQKNAQFARKKKASRCLNCMDIRRNKRLNPIRIKVIRLNESSVTRLHVGKCIHCDIVFSSKRIRRTCSNKCSERHSNRLKDHRKRSRYKDVGFDKTISLKKLIQIDENVCYLCGVECDSNDYTTDDRGSFIVGKTYPSIEHVIPVSKGGSHTWDNVRLAHHYCNTIKRDTEINGNIGQLSMGI